jgi:hypothetical protein
VALERPPEAEETVRLRPRATRPSDRLNPSKDGGLPWIFRDGFRTPGRRFGEASSLLPALMKRPNTFLIHGPPPLAQCRLDASTIANLVGRRGSGVTIAAPADEFGIHRTTVMAHLRRAGA